MWARIDFIHSRHGPVHMAWIDFIHSGHGPIHMARIDFINSRHRPVCMAWIDFINTRHWPTSRVPHRYTTGRVFPHCTRTCVHRNLWRVRPIPYRNLRGVMKTFIISSPRVTTCNLYAYGPYPLCFMPYALSFYPMLIFLSYLYRHPQRHMFTHSALGTSPVPCLPIYYSSMTSSAAPQHYCALCSLYAIGQLPIIPLHLHSTSYHPIGWYNLPLLSIGLCCIYDCI